MRFTDNPFEKMMREVPKKYPQEKTSAPHNSKCRGCSFWQGMPCVATCYRKLKRTSGHVVPKSEGAA